MHDRSGDRLLGQRRASRRRRAARHRWVAAAVVVAVALAGAGWSTAELLATWREERAARATAAVADAVAEADADTLARRRTALAAADRALAVAEDRLQRALDDLFAAIGERHGVTNELVRARDELASLEEAVSVAEGEAVANEHLATQLASCLDGVSVLLNQISVGDPRAADTAAWIAPSCEAVGMALR